MLRGKFSVFVKTMSHVRLFFLLPPRMWLARDQTQPRSFSRERKKPGNEVGPAAARSGSLICSSNNNNNNNKQNLKTIQNQMSTKELLCRTITIRDNKATSLLVRAIFRVVRAKMT